MLADLKKKMDNEVARGTSEAKAKNEPSTDTAEPVAKKAASKEEKIEEESADNQTSAGDAEKEEDKV